MNVTRLCSPESIGESAEEVIAATKHFVTASRASRRLNSRGGSFRGMTPKRAANPEDDAFPSACDISRGLVSPGVRAAIMTAMLELARILAKV